MSDWAEHDGLSNPFARTLVEVRLRDGRIERNLAGDLDWECSDSEPESDIVAFRIVSPEAPASSKEEGE